MDTSVLPVFKRFYRDWVHDHIMDIQLIKREGAFFLEVHTPHQNPAVIALDAFKDIYFDSYSTIFEPNNTLENALGIFRSLPYYEFTHSFFKCYPKDVTGLIFKPAAYSSLELYFNPEINNYFDEIEYIRYILPHLKTKKWGIEFCHGGTTLLFGFDTMNGMVDYLRHHYLFFRDEQAAMGAMEVNNEIFYDRFDRTVDVENNEPLKQFFNSLSKDEQFKDTVFAEQVSDGLTLNWFGPMEAYHKHSTLPADIVDLSDIDCITTYLSLSILYGMITGCLYFTMDEWKDYYYNILCTNAYEADLFYEEQIFQCERNVEYLKDFMNGPINPVLKQAFQERYDALMAKVKIWHSQ